MKKFINLKGVRQNNLKCVDVDIPLGRFTVLCGPSGSGKSSLAFETLYAEGQRRYIESLSNYTKQFLDKAPKPLLESAENIPPALAITQKNSVKNSRSTLGTHSELLDDLKALYEKLGRAVCHDHKTELESYDPVKGADKILQVFENKRGFILTPIYYKKCIFKKDKLLKFLIAEGFLRIYKATSSRVKYQKNFGQCDFGEISLLDDVKTLPDEDFFVVVDRLCFEEKEKSRMIDSLSQAYQFFCKVHNHAIDGEATILTPEGERVVLSSKNLCFLCGFYFKKITSHLFSFNHPQGACQDCDGFGRNLILSEDKVVPDPSLTLYQGAIKPFFLPSANRQRNAMEKFCHEEKIDLHIPWQNLSQKHRKWLWEGHKKYKGVVGHFNNLETKKYKLHVRVFLSRFNSEVICETCQGARLNKEALQVLFRKMNIAEMCDLTLEKLYNFFKNVKLSKFEKEVVESLYQQIILKLEYLNKVGLGYLTLSRRTRTLSGGEFQRMSLASQLGLGLSETLYILDEPTVGLHPRDTEKLVEILKSLQSSDNTLVVVEHDVDVIRNSQFVIEMGPRSGIHGGEITFSGEFRDFLKKSELLTPQYLKRQEGSKNMVPMLPIPRPLSSSLKEPCALKIKGCKGHNLKNLDVTIPLNKLVVVTGVSGSGKSSLVLGTLYPAVAKTLYKEHLQALEFDTLKGVEHIKDVISIGQNPIGKNARSHPASYLQIYSLIRSIMATTPQARLRGYTPRHFSLNVDEGRCPDCQGLGTQVIDMVFMDDIELLCDTCGGKKFQDEILEVFYKDKNILDILNMTFLEAKDFFTREPGIRRVCETLEQVGLGYLSLGQSTATLSGGESQRLKLARKLTEADNKDTLFVIDEPTTGLHPQEIGWLLKIFHHLVNTGSSLIVIEHNLEVIASADHIIDLGPEAGPRGGELVAEGTPFDIQGKFQTQTARYLHQYLYRTKV